MPTVRRIRSGTLVLYPEKLFNKGGQVGRWADRVALRMDQAVTAAAPERTGNLKTRISSATRRAGPTMVTLSLRAPHYARFVDEGTDSGGYGVIIGQQNAYGPGFPGSVGGRYYEYTTWVPGEVAGQRAQHFIEAGMSRVGRSHPSIASIDWSAPWGDDIVGGI
jgi:hypothetical protein